MFWLLCLAASSLFLFYHFYWKRKNLPPGPFPLPLLGNLHTFYKYNPPVELFKVWKKKYGKVFTYWFGGKPVVVITDYDLIMETVQRDGAAYENRPDASEFMEVFKVGDIGVGAANGDVWREQRRYILRVLREFGLGRNIMQEMILEEFSHVITALRNETTNDSKETALIPLIDIGVGSIINNLLFGYRFDGPKSDEFHFLKNTVNRQFNLLGNPTVMIMRYNMKLFGRLPYFKGFYEEMIRNRDALYEFYKKNIEEHKRRIDYNSDSAPTDFCEAYLKEIRKLEESSKTGHYFSEDRLISNLFDFWMAGQETSSTTIAVGMIYLLLYPEVQEKLHAELDAVIGSDRLVTLEDKPNLPYTNAVVQEMLRLCIAVGMAPQRETTREVIIDGYEISKGTAIEPLGSVVLQDERFFPVPKKFYPERYIDKNGKFTPCEQVITFGVGKRICPGESLARMEVYLFVANVLNQFKFSVIPGKEPTLKRQVGVGSQPFPYVCRVEDRFGKGAKTT